MKGAMLCFLPMAVAVALANFTGNHNCVRTCGDRRVPFPFGLVESCTWNLNLVLSCDDTTGNGTLILGENIPVYDISVENGTMIIGVYRTLNCYNSSGVQRKGSYDKSWIKVNGHYTFSDTRNKLTVLGCDTMARMSDAEGSFGCGCFSYCCEDINFTAESSCSGLGCCQTSIPKNLWSLNIAMDRATNDAFVQDFSSCGSAFVVDQESFNVSHYKLPVLADMREDVLSRAVLDWVVERNMTCKEAQSNRSNYACGANSFCSDVKNGDGYRCLCKNGYTGNPYASILLPLPGCQDIDECQDSGRYACQGKCKNTAGNYTCKCSFGMTGDGKVDCQISRLTIIAADLIIGHRSTTVA